MRCTKVALNYKKTGNMPACQILLGHSRLESTVRCFRVDIEDAFSLSEDNEIVALKDRTASKASWDRDNGWPEFR